MLIDIRFAIGMSALTAVGVGYAMYNRGLRHGLTNLQHIRAAFVAATAEGLTIPRHSSAEAKPLVEHRRRIVDLTPEERADVIASLYQESSECIEQTHPGSTRENPYSPTNATLSGTPA